MAFINFTNRIELKCNAEPIGSSDFIVYASSKQNKLFIFSQNFDRVKLEIKKKIQDIDFKKVNIFLEVYRDAFRKEISLGTLENIEVDKIEFFEKKVTLNKKIDRNLDQIDSSTARCRIVFSYELKNIASSESMGFRPIIISELEEVIQVEKKIKKALIGVLEEEMDKLYYSDFHGESPHEGAPTIYVNKKLNVRKDLSTDKRIAAIIFTTSFEDLLKKSLINPDNKFKSRLIEYAQNHNETIKSSELIDKIKNELSVEDFFYDETVNEFISNAVEGYIQDRDFLAKYTFDQERLNNQTPEEEHED